jgi:hypothetical protein
MIFTGAPCRLQAEALTLGRSSGQKLNLERTRSPNRACVALEGAYSSQTPTFRIQPSSPILGHLRNPSRLPPKMNSSRAPNVAPSTSYRSASCNSQIRRPCPPNVDCPRRAMLVASRPAAAHLTSVFSFSFLARVALSIDASLPSLDSSLPFPWSDLQELVPFHLTISA